MKLSKLIALIIIAASISSCALFKGAKGNDPIVLNYAIPEGQEIVLTSTSESEINSEQMGQLINITTESSSVMSVKSLGTNEDGTTDLEISYTDLTQSATSPMGEGDTDFSSIIGKVFSLDLAPKGDCNNFEGFDDLDPIANALGEMVDGDIYKQGIEQMFSELPEGPVKVGTTWQEEVSTETPYAGGTLKTSGTIDYTITEIKDIDGIACVIIQTVSNIKTSGAFQQQGMDLELNRTSKGDNTTAFAYKKGMFLSSEMSNIASGIIDIPSVNMSIPQDVKVTGSWKVEFK